MATAIAGAADLSPEAWNFLESRVAAFEKAWKAGKRPAIEKFCPRDPADDPSEGWLLPELVHADLEFRLQAGEPARVEQYLERYPVLGRRPDTVADLIETEFRIRHASEPALSPEEYRRRFPEQIERLIGRQSSSATTRFGADDATAIVPLMRPSIPGFEIGPLLGRGGMGVVYEARDRELNRAVAVKVLHGGSDARGEQRLRREAEAAAGLQHSHVVQVHQTGSFAGGAFIVMELLPGGNLAERIDGTPLPPGEAAALLEPLARAVEFAHSRGVIHRDLKPANVLFAGDGTPKVADFGLAKQIEDDAMLTQTGTMAGSPSYMAPEQALGRKDVGPAVDVWALGAILYEMLTGRPPFRGATALDTMDLVRRSDPVPPCRLVPRLSRDLETICLKCLEKEPGKRYASAEALVEDISRYRRGEMIRARPISRFEHARRWTAQNKAVATLWMLLGLSLLGGTSASLWYAAIAHQNATESAKHLRSSRLSEAKAKQLAEQANRLAEEAKRRTREAQQYAAEAREQERQTRKLLVARDMERATEALEAGDPKQAAEFVSAHFDDPVAHPFVLNCMERFARCPRREIYRGDAPVYFVGFSPDGKLLAACGADGCIRFFGTTDWEHLATLESGQGELNGLAFSADGRRIASSGDDGTVVLWDLMSGTRIWKSPVFEKLAFDLEFALDDRLLVVSGDNSWIRLLDPSSGRIVDTFKAHADDVESIAVTPDGQAIVSSGANHWAACWDLSRRRQRWSSREPGPAGLKAVSISSDGRWAAFGSGRSTVWITNLRDGSTIFHGPIESDRSATTDGASVRSVTFVGSDHDLLVSAEGTHLEITRVVNGRLVPASGDARPYWAVDRRRIRSLASRGDVVVSASDDGVIDLWQRSDSPAWRRLAAPAANDFDWFTKANGQQALAIVSNEGQYTLDPDSGRIQQCDPSAVKAICATPHGRRVLALSSKGTPSCWDLSGEKPRRLWLRHRSSFLTGVFGRRTNEAAPLHAAIVAPPMPQRSFFVFVDATSTLPKRGIEECALMLVDSETGESVRRLELVAGTSEKLAISPDGRAIAIIPLSRHGEVQILETEAFSDRNRFVAHPVDVYGLAFSPIERLLATSGNDAAIRLWRDGTMVREMLSGNSLVRDLQFSPDGRLLVAASNDQPPRVWDVESGRLLLDFSRLLAHAATDKPRWLPVKFSPDGSRIAVFQPDSILILDGRPLAE